MPNMQRIGKYQVLETIGRGGMGVVVKAKDPSLGRIVAIKMMTSGYTGDREFLKRFYREAQSTGSLHHPNIVTVHELGDQDGVPYLVMEFLEGESLESMISAHRELMLLDKINFMVQVCSGLQYAHERHVIHRDIKPANIMVLNGGQVKIVDFGIARMGNDQLTRPGQVIGSIHYMAPEQIRESVVDARCDIFSTGVALYQLLTYTLPFQARDTAGTLLKIVQDPPPPLSLHLKDYPPELNDIIERALAKDPSDRYETADDLGVDLIQVQSQLKRALVDSRVDDAHKYIESGEFTRCRELLLQALKIDPQNRRANESMRHIQQMAQQQRRGEQARQLRMNAEEALQEQQFEKALRYLDQAIAIDDQEELRTRRAAVEELKKRFDKIRDALRRADAARGVGNFDLAMQSLEQALALDPENAAAKAARAEMANDAARHEQQRHVQGIVREARKQISSRKFTDALQMLKRAEELDPGSANLREMIQLATTGREQEQRRKQIESLAAEIQEALNRDDYVEANRVAEGALQRFPSEGVLLKLKGLADHQRSVAERRVWVEGQLAAARKSLDAGDVAQALATIEAAAQKHPTDPALHSFLVLVRDTAAQRQSEARKAEVRKKAKEALRRRAYEEAIELLKAGKTELATDDFDDLIQFAQGELESYSHLLKVDAVASQAQSLIDVQEYDEAIELLERALSEMPDEELRLVLADARRRQDEMRQRVAEAADAAQQLVTDEKATQAISLLEAQPTSFRQHPQIQEALDSARNKQAWLQEITGEQERIRQALLQSKSDLAEQMMNAALARFGARPEFAMLQDTIQAQRSASDVATVEKAMREAMLLMKFGSFTSAVEKLASVATCAAHLPEIKKTEFEQALTAARTKVEQSARQAENVQAQATNQNEIRRLTGTQVSATAMQETVFAPLPPRQFGEAQLRNRAAAGADDLTLVSPDPRIAVPDTPLPQAQPRPQLVVNTPPPQEETTVRPIDETMIGEMPISENVLTMPLRDLAPSEESNGSGEYLLHDLDEGRGRKSLWICVAAALVLAVVGGGIWFWHNNQSATTLSQRVQQTVTGNALAAQVRATVTDGVVVLSGEVSSEASLDSLVSQVGKLEGVVRVDKRNLHIARATAPPLSEPKSNIQSANAVPTNVQTSPSANTRQENAAQIVDGHAFQSDATPPAEANGGRIAEMLALARHAHDEGSYDDEIRHYDAVLKLDPNNGVARKGKQKAIRAKQADPGAQSSAEQ